jgi:hypothetical protein
VVGQLPSPSQVSTENVSLLQENVPGLHCPLHAFFRQTNSHGEPAVGKLPSASQVSNVSPLQDVVWGLH